MDEPSGRDNEKKTVKKNATCWLAVALVPKADLRAVTHDSEEQQGQDYISIVT
jgi:hypothetical protein